MRARHSTVHDAVVGRRVNALGLAWAVNTLALSIVHPFILIYLYQERGIPLKTASLVFPIMGAAKIIGAPIAGILADRYGQRALVLTSTYGRFVVFYALALLIGRNAPFAAIAAALFCSALLGSFFPNAANAYVTDLVVPEDYTLAFGRVRVGLNIGWMIGPAIGSLLLGFTPFFLLFALTGSLCGVVGMVFSRFCPHMPVPAPPSKTEPASPTGQSWLMSPLVPLLAMSMLLFMSVSQFTTTLSVYSTSVVGIARTSLGFLYSINGGMVILLLLPMNWLLRRYSLHGRLAAGALLYVASYVCFGLSHSWLHLALVMALMSIGEILSLPSITAAVGQRAGVGMSGRYMGLLGFVEEVGWACGPWLGSIAFAHYSTRPLFLWLLLSGGAACAALGFAVMAVTAKVRKHVGKEKLQVTGDR